ncbi:MAG: UdgX family uracil-DNA binding protein [Acetobacteraceae bacterium]
MPNIALRRETDWDGWRHATRALVLAGVEPADIQWSVGGQSGALPDGKGTFNVPRALVDVAMLAIQARHADRFGLLYSLVWRVNQGEKLLETEGDPDLLLARRLAFAVRAEAHRMRTNIRFLPAGNRLLGWYAPAHYVLEANSQVLVRRFPDSVFSIITPDASAHWDGSTLRFGPGLPQADDDDMLQAWWSDHGMSVLDEAAPGTSVAAAEDLSEVPRPPDRPAIGPVVLTGGTDPGLLDAIREAATCRRCDLYANATQTVFGEGPSDAPVMFVGEQPGDQEDVIGRPFVGPAGQLLDRALEEAGIDRRTVYITNAVKHFKFTPRGKRRIHQAPDAGEIRICRFWLDVERVHVRPKLLVLMGASGARAVLGRAVTVTRERGRPLQLEDGQQVFITVHPSYLLRIPDGEGKEREYKAFVRDMQAIRELMHAT